jgi:hypothetical protein
MFSSSSLSEYARYSLASFNSSAFASLDKELLLFIDFIGSTPVFVDMA